MATLRITGIDNQSPITYVNCERADGSQIAFALHGPNEIFVDHRTRGYWTICKIDYYSACFDANPHVRAALNIDSCANVFSDNPTCDNNCRGCSDIELYV